ncbi:hypothetical protein QBC44DRAFT_313841 [Cladorrhinum sp. PSN332]|nr:hypothetical protein QBC44DRAFT_313841 [Cladorrhinum sp. PSN332]
MATTTTTPPGGVSSLSLSTSNPSTFGRLRYVPAGHTPNTLHLNSPLFSLTSWKDPSLLKHHYIPDTAEMMKQITGCRTVIADPLVLRSAAWTDSGHDALAKFSGNSEKQIEEMETTFPAGGDLCDWIV